VNLDHPMDLNGNMSTFVPKLIREFCQAAGQSFSYNLKRNLYIWFGILWGLPVPVVTILIQIHFLEKAGSQELFLDILRFPAQWFFLAHPLLFGLVFGILGTIRSDKDRELKKAIKNLKKQSFHDPLTGLKNRRFFVHNYHDECARSLRRKEAIFLLFLDIDNFKMVNDTYGHHLGDVVLKELGKYLSRKCRPYDIPVRWGGEEFLIFLRATDETAAVLYTERIRLGIESGLSPAISFPITVSIGVAQYEDNDTLDQLCDRADRALYHAKQTGKNRVISWGALQRDKQAENDIYPKGSNG
jgi:diguanylate cyclase (GGDEF)-like protein